MQRWIQHMIQLQDLIFAREQQQASMQVARMSALDASIEAMERDLPDEIRSHFQKIYKRGTLAIVPIANGVCSACGMAIPISQVHAVHAAEKIYTCPNCARFLFYQTSAPRRLASQRRRGEPAQVGLARFSSPRLMIPQLSATDRDGVLAEMSARLEAEGFVDNAGRLAEEAVKREVIASTAVDPGLAFPHVRGVEGGGLTLVLGISRKGVKFGGRTLSRIIFFMVIPTAASAFYLKLLSGLTRSFRDESARDLLLKARTPDELWKALTKATRSTVP
ncbi:MAG: PTS sugar transporter subunit IIA [Kiritimatiellae bacterium]|nr:PTS sugar transporter subunit IIA [Kiritimatiellia bacterium]MDW8459401.1 PTS sugar transporter subunit IIA [Verrucomicrobiota bacterium]